MTEQGKETKKEEPSPKPELVDALFPAVLARDLPGMCDIDASLLLFSRWIKKQATVGLSGECADEVFGGYPWFYRQAGNENMTFPWASRLDERLKLYSPALINAVHPQTYVKQRYQEALEEVPRYKRDLPVDADMRELFYINLTRWMPTLLDRKDRMSMATANAPTATAIVSAGDQPGPAPISPSPLPRSAGA